MSCPIETHQFLTSWTTSLDDNLKEIYKDTWIDDKKSGYFGFIPKDPVALFIGTFPVPEQRTSGFFYHSDVNLFWKIITKVTGQNLLNLDSKLDWLSKSRIGITDILCKAQRTDNNCTSRADNDLNAICFNNILNLFNDYPTLTDVYLTSGGPTSKSLSGKSAGGWLGLHLRDATGRSLKKIISSGATQVIKLQPNQKQINLHFLITPAPQDNQLGRYLRDKRTVVNGLNQINYLEGIPDPKEKYKFLQWAVYLSKFPGLVNHNFQAEVEQKNLRGLLMEWQ
ncbi:hypothetical protein GCM10027578_35600 [Spirosoma luteolum]